MIIYFSPTSSIGIAMFPNDGSSVDELLDHADQAFYLAKKDWKEQLYLYQCRSYLMKRLLNFGKA